MKFVKKVDGWELCIVCNQGGAVEWWPVQTPDLFDMIRAYYLVNPDPNTCLVTASEWRGTEPTSDEKEDTEVR